MGKIKRISWGYFTLIAICLFILSLHDAHAAQCGYANGSSYSSPPQAVGSLCVAGTAGGVTGNGPWNWTCTDGGGTVNCSSSICGVNYTWETGSFNSCSAPCGGGSQSRSVICKRSDGPTVADSYCPSPKPATSQSCNTQACAPTYTYAWNAGGFGSCSASCGGGTQTQPVTCRRNDGVDVADGYCTGAKPPTSQSCNTQACAEACIPSGQPVTAGQTRCPSNSCFFWVSGVGPGLTTITGITNNSTTYGGSTKVGETDAVSNLVGPGDYPYSYQNPNGSDGPFKAATDGTFDGLAIGSNTRVRIYSDVNFGGTLLLDIHGPRVLSNCPTSKANGIVGWGANCNSWISQDWSSGGTLFAQFPPSTRENTSYNMWNLGGGSRQNCRPAPGPPNIPPICTPNPNYGKTSVRVTCD